MIGHEAETQHLDRGGLSVVFEQAEVHVTVCGGEEDVAALVAALGDVMGTLGNDDSRESRYTG